METEIVVDSFDREWTLRELLEAVNLPQLENLLSLLLGSFRLLDDRGTPVLGETRELAAPARRELHYDMETVGVLEAQADDRHLEAACGVIALLLHSCARYLMASALHVEVVKDDYEELLHRHAALAESERRYKELSANLEQRVAEQVTVIQDTQRKLYHAEKLASVGQLAAGVAHEINNPVGFIHSNLTTALSYAEQLRDFDRRVRRADEDLAAAWRRAELDYMTGDLPDLLGETVAGVQRIAAIVRDLKGFSRIDSAGHAPADLNEILRSVTNIAAGQIRDRATVVLEPADLPPLTCDAAALGQAFLNLLLNAVEAMDRPGTVRFITGVDADRIWVRVSDDGRGIPGQIRERIFDPFFTTKDVGRGTGLGLTVCHDVVTAHGGCIGVDSGPHGTTMTVTLPLAGGCDRD